jgi:hypothetical protein
VPRNMAVLRKLLEKGLCLQVSNDFQANTTLTESLRDDRQP